MQKGLAHQGKTAQEFPLDGKLSEIGRGLAAACRASASELPTRSANPADHMHTSHRALGGSSRQTCKNDMRLLLANDPNRLKMYGKVRQHMSRYLAG